MLILRLTYLIVIVIMLSQGIFQSLQIGFKKEDMPQIQTILGL
uniref:Uncharacterized protein n=1 Tax=virus sp. ctrcb4 TaxID=2825824 RepID=A0A8S5RPQ6_9VIRU|nr:MAG TPA: hypothetical protein [virus sp. ctrcb4]DAR12715.1 MAG TPA: hypothetical protein [Crassvirales sp.]